jgi:hypothetical protein
MNVSRRLSTQQLEWKATASETKFTFLRKRPSSFGKPAMSKCHALPSLYLSGYGHVDVLSPADNASVVTLEPGLCNVKKRWIARARD